MSYLYLVFWFEIDISDFKILFVLLSWRFLFLYTAIFHLAFEKNNYWNRVHWKPHKSFFIFLQTSLPIWAQMFTGLMIWSLTITESTLPTNVNQLLSLCAHIETIDNVYSVSRNGSLQRNVVLERRIPKTFQSEKLFCMNRFSDCMFQY